MARSYTRDTMGRFAPSGGGGKAKKGKAPKRGKMKLVRVPLSIRGFSKSQLKKMYG